MKKTLKIFATVLAVTLALLSFAFIASASDATETTEKIPEIASTNIAYTGNYGLVVAIEANSVNDSANLRVDVWSASDKSDIITYSPKSQTPEALGNIEGQYYVVETNFTAQKDLDKVYTYQAYEVGAANKGEEMTYSCAQYFFERLFVNDIVNAEADTTDALRKEFYVTTLKQAALAQELLYNNNYKDGVLDTSDDKAVLVDALNFASVPGYDVAIYANDTTEVELLAFGGTVPEGKKFAGYSVIKYAADYTATTTEAQAGETVTIDAHTVVKAVFVDAEKRGNGLYYNNQGDYTGTAVDYEWNGVFNKNVYPNAAGSTYATLSDGALGIFVKNNVGARVLNTLHDVGTKHVAETDIMFNNIAYNATQTRFAAISLTSGTDGKFSRAFLPVFAHAISEGEKVTAIRLCTYADDSTKGIICELNPNEWYNLRFEIEETTTMIQDEEKVALAFKLYVDNDLVYETVYYDSTYMSRYTGECQAIGFEPRGDREGIIYIDNSFVGTIVSAD